MFSSFAFTHYMDDLPPMSFEIIGNQGPMTTPPNGFRAHDGGRPGRVGKSASRTDSSYGEIEKPGDPVTKFFRLYVIGIAAEGCVTPRGVA